MLNDYLKPADVNLSDEMREVLVAQVINTLNVPMLSPLQRYARSRFLLNVMEAVCKEEGAAAEAYCEQEGLGLEGKQFERDGLRFIRQFTLDYNYEKNDDEGKLKEASKQETLCKRQLEDAKKQVKRAKEDILVNHPNMQPLVQRVTIKWISYEK